MESTGQQNEVANSIHSLTQEPLKTPESLNFRRGGEEAEVTLRTWVTTVPILLGCWED